MSARVKVSFCGVSEASGADPMDEAGVDEDVPRLDETRLHLSPRFTHLRHGIASSHC